MHLSADVYCPMGLCTRICISVRIYTKAWSAACTNAGHKVVHLLTEFADFQGVKVWIDLHLVSLGRASFLKKWSWVCHAGNMKLSRLNLCLLWRVHISVTELSNNVFWKVLCFCFPLLIVCNNCILSIYLFSKSMFVLSAVSCNEANFFYSSIILSIMPSTVCFCSDLIFVIHV